MWGAPSSGKTTFLAALNIALTRQRGPWSLTGADSSSTDALIALTQKLTARQFPQPTGALEEFTWLLERISGRGARRRLFGRQRPQPATAISLNLVDPNGEVYGGEAKYVDVWTDLISSLEQSRGVVFLFDPIREAKEGDAFAYTFAALSQLASRMAESPFRINGRLPHYVAVCITKFDEPHVLQTAERTGLLTRDPEDKYEFPRIAEEDAEEFFVTLCEVSRTGNADLVVNTLRQRFLPDRIRFFVTSAIGFYVDPGNGGNYDPADYQNELPDSKAPRGTSIRGAVHPINVSEPMLWLAEKLAGE